jgi:F-type H+-transporting ATPase subunit a
VRQVIGVVLLLNGVAIFGAALTGNLPQWPPPLAEIHIADLAGTPIIHIGGEEHPPEGGVIRIWNDISISNSIITSWIVMAALVVVGALASRVVGEVPGRLQGFFELIVQVMADFMRQAGGADVVKHLPLFGTLFLFALVCNWLGLVPFVGQIELLRSPTADYHTNLAMAVIGFAWYQVVGIRRHGLGYFTRWINFTGFREGYIVGPVMVLVGIIDLISELVRILTLTLRLWANIWGGELVLSVLAALVLIPSFLLPFIGLELFVGLIQAFVFAFLVVVYIILALESHGGHEEHADSRESTHADHAEHAARAAA